MAPTCVLPPGVPEALRFVPLAAVLAAGAGSGSGAGADASASAFEFPRTTAEMKSYAIRPRPSAMMMMIVPPTSPAPRPPNFLLINFSTFGNMNAAQLGAMAAGQKDAAGPTMLFAQIESAGLGEADGGGGGSGGGEPISQEQTEAVGERFQYVRNNSWDFSFRGYRTVEAHTRTRALWKACGERNFPVFGSTTLSQEEHTLLTRHKTAIFEGGIFTSTLTSFTCVLVIPSCRSLPCLLACRRTWQFEPPRE